MINFNIVDNNDLDSIALKIDAKAEEDNGGGKMSAATALVEIANKVYDFGISDTGETFGVPKSGPKVVQMLRAGKTSLRSQLARLYFKNKGKAAPQQALADALLILEGTAQETEPKKLHLRVARHNNATWLDLGDATARAICITNRGWSVEAESPVLFKRSALTGILPEPQLGGTLDLLWSLLNVAEKDRALVAAWLVSALYADIPHPILLLDGEQGSGKSTAEKMLVSLLDPGPVPLRKPPRDVENWVTAASGSWVVGIDNVSNVSDWMSDAFCRAVTGDGDVRRQLYSDGNIYVFSFRRCLILNGIDIGAVRGDLADRLLAINLCVIPEDRRLTEGGLWPRWNAAHAKILGAVLDLGATVADALSSVVLDRKPRMADFAVVLAATDIVLGTSGLHRYLEKQGELAVDSLTADAFVQAIEKLGAFEGTSAQLMIDVPKPEKLPQGWPANSRAATQILRRQAPVMRKAGWQVEDDGGRNHRKVAIWKIHPKPEIAGISAPPIPQYPRGPGGAGIAGDAGHKNGQSQHEVGSECTQCGIGGDALIPHDGALWHPECRQYWVKSQSEQSGRPA